MKDCSLEYRFTLQKPHSSTYNKILNAKVGFLQSRIAFPKKTKVWIL